MKFTLASFVAALFIFQAAATAVPAAEPVDLVERAPEAVAEPGDYYDGGYCKYKTVTTTEYKYKYKTTTEYKTVYKTVYKPKTEYKTVYKTVYKPKTEYKTVYKTVYKKKPYPVYTTIYKCKKKGHGYGYGYN